mgnify:CR=1 FL=1
MLTSASNMFSNNIYNGFVSNDKSRQIPESFLQLTTDLLLKTVAKQHELQAQNQHLEKQLGEVREMAMIALAVAVSMLVFSMLKDK